MFFSFSKQNFLSEVASPFSLPDHSPSFKEYTGSKNNRFLSPAQASKNRIQPPSKVYTHSHSTLFRVPFVRWNFSKQKKNQKYSLDFLRQILHFFNTPPSLSEDQLMNLFNARDAPPTAVRMFPLKTERSSSGLIEFPSVAEAVIAIMKCNHIPVENKGESK